MPEERFRELARHFLQRSCPEWRAMLELAQRGRAGDEAAYRELFALAHRFCGSAGMLGFVEISEQAGRIETLLRDASAQQQIDWRQIDVLLQRLGDQLTRAAGY